MSLYIYTWYQSCLLIGLLKFIPWCRSCGLFGVKSVCEEDLQEHQVWLVWHWCFLSTKNRELKDVASQFHSFMRSQVGDLIFGHLMRDLALFSLFTDKIQGAVPGYVGMVTSFSAFCEKALIIFFNFLAFFYFYFYFCWLLCPGL